MGRNDDDIDASIQAPTVFGGIVGDRVKLGVTGGGEPLGINALAHEQELDDLGSAGGGEFPVRLKLNRVDGDVVGMAFNAEIAFHRGENSADTVKGFQGAGAQRRRAAFEKSDLAKAEDEPLGSLAQRDGTAI
jgi:hypothetical protein